MKYRDEWKGRLRITFNGNVMWDGTKVGHVYSRYRKGAKTRAGMETNMVYLVTGRDTEFDTMSNAVASLIPTEGGSGG